MNNNIRSLLISFILAMVIIDIICFSLVKYIYIHNKINQLWLIVPALLYGGQMILFYISLKYIHMVTLNIIWNIISSMIVTIIGIYLFKENLNLYQIIAIIFGLISIILFSLH
jgi:small multidrug resistance pump